MKEGKCKCRRRGTANRRCIAHRQCGEISKGESTCYYGQGHLGALERCCVTSISLLYEYTHSMEKKHSARSPSPNLEVAIYDPFQEPSNSRHSDAVKSCGLQTSTNVDPSLGIAPASTDHQMEVGKLSQFHLLRPLNGWIEHKLVCWLQFDTPH